MFVVYALYWAYVWFVTAIQRGGGYAMHIDRLSATG